MKNMLVISLATLILATAMKDLTMFAFFKINQTDIIERACINKEKPMVMCHGKCFFQKKIVEINDTESSQPLAQKVNKPSSLTMFLTTIPIIHFTELKVHTQSSFFYEELYAQSFLSTLFEPPKMAA